MKHITIIVVAMLSLVISYPVSQAKAAPIMNRSAVTTSKVAVASSVVAQAQAAPQPVAPAPAPPPRPVYAATGTCTTYASLFTQYGWNSQIGMAICQAESGGNPNAVSPTDDYGLMQIHNGLEIYGQQIFDPAFNVSIAYNVKYKGNAWRPWSTYNSGAYLRYMQ